MLSLCRSNLNDWMQKQLSMERASVVVHVYTVLLVFQQTPVCWKVLLNLKCVISVHLLAG